MASLMDELVGVLQEEIEAYEELVTVSAQKTQYIVNADLEKMEASVD